MGVAYPEPKVRVAPYDGAPYELSLPRAALDGWLVDAVKEGLVVFGRGDGPATLEMNADEQARCRALLEDVEDAGEA